MRVSCPSCGAIYDVPDNVLATGARRLRCARCAEEWVPERPPAESAPAGERSGPEPSPPPDRPLDRPLDPSAESPSVPPARAGGLDAPATPLVAGGVAASATPLLVASPPLVDKPGTRPGASGASVAFAWVASLLLLAGLVLAAYLFRDTVQASWPPSRTLYAALGLS